jgi:HlyD family secretion protein
MKRLAAAGAIGMVLGIVFSCAGCRHAGETAPVVEVRRAPFEKTLSLTGTISAKETLNLSAPTQGKLSFVVMEGQVVKSGDVVFALETKQMKDTLDAARIDLTVARSSLSKAEEEIRTSKVKNALSIRESDATLAHAQLELDRAQKDLAKKQRQVENRILPAAEIPSAELQVEQARLGLENARIAREKLDEEMKSGKETLALDRDAAAARLSKSQAQVSEAEDFLGKATVTAPRDGVAVHARSWRGQEWKAGDDVWQRQPVIELPDLSVMQVELDVHEADISDVKPGVPARIRFEAWPDLVLTGRISDVSGVAKELRDRDGKNTGVRAFDAKIALDAQDQRLRPGMTARVELVLDRRDDALVVPIAAIRKDGDASKVVLASGEKRDVKVAATSADLAVIESGLKEGDCVQVEAARPAEGSAPSASGPEPPAAPPAPPPGAALPQAGG